MGHGMISDMRPDNILHDINDMRTDSIGHGKTMNELMTWDMGI